MNIRQTLALDVVGAHLLSRAIRHHLCYNDGSWWIKLYIWDGSCSFRCHRNSQVKFRTLRFSDQIWMWLIENCIDAFLCEWISKSNQSLLASVPRCEDKGKVLVESSEISKHKETAFCFLFRIGRLFDCRLQLNAEHKCYLRSRYETTKRKS